MSFQAVNHPSKAGARRAEEPRERSPSPAQSSSHRSGQATDDDDGRTTSERWPSLGGASAHGAGKHAPARTVEPPIEPQTTSRPADLPQSEPMTATTSSSSNVSHKDAAGTGPSPYGTRSRNRPTTSRPNYAEDVEMEFETSAHGANGSTQPRTSSSRRASGTPPSNDAQQGGTAGSKKGSSSGQSPWSTANQKESPIPGMSTFSANPNANMGTSKKRKSTGHHTTSNRASSPEPTTQAVTRRSNTTANAVGARETNMMFYEKTRVLLRNGSLQADDGTTLNINDHVYLVCEPPGEPYYLGRIMEFIHTKSDQPASPIEAIRCNWYYRPRDIGRFQQDSRLVYATMHSDVCPITSLRGKCQIVHRSDMSDFEAYRKEKNSFYFSQVFDRFMHRWFEVIPTKQVINVPERVKKALDERWKYIVVENSRVKELTSAVKTCKRCVGYCASHDSVECAVCKNTYHMQCVRPPLAKKPSRGFAWACAPCSRAQERKLEARRTPIIGDVSMDAEEEEFVEEEEEDGGAGANTTAASPTGENPAVDMHPGTQAEIALAKMWPMRYLGIHCRVEDALQYDDRAIYPRASSRLGPRHQANVNIWHGQPVELVKPAEIRKRYVKNTSHKKDGKFSRDTIAAIEADRLDKAKRPKWVQDEPPGYVRRGEDHSRTDSNRTVTVSFKMPSADLLPSRGDDDRPADYEKLVDDYMTRAKGLAKNFGLKEYSTNFLDRALQLFHNNNYDPDAALKQLKKQDKYKDLREPQLDKEEMKRFEEGVARYGSELRQVRMHVRTVSHGNIVRYYYMWKKTPKGREIWGAYEGRKGTKRKVEADVASRLLDDVADDHDDSAFDSNKAVARKRQFQCKFCSRRHARQWRRAPGVAPGSTAPADGRIKDRNPVVIALCQRCAYLWRKYAVEYESLDEVTRKVAQVGGKAWRKRIDQELLDELDAAQEEEARPSLKDLDRSAAAAAPYDQPKKRQKIGQEKEPVAAKPAPEPVPKKKPAPPPRPPTPPPVPAEPKMRTLPCAVCLYLEPMGDQLMECHHCKMTVHRGCYGVDEQVSSAVWLCDTCLNDRKETVSYHYECVLCPVTHTEQDLVEPPRVSHKKKTDREREKERLEKELAVQFADDYRREQRERGRPEMPREPLKRTVENNWVHVQCAIWSPETRFSNAKALELVEGIGPPSIPLSRYQQLCKLCKSNKKGACVSCLQCHAPFHVACAHQAGHLFGFDITPVKSSRRDQVHTVTIGPETGSMTAVVWCREHSVKTIVHEMSEIVDVSSGMNALQLFVRNYKQADLTLTGTARKATLLDHSSKVNSPTAAVVANNRRASTTTVAAARGGRRSSVGAVKTEDRDGESHLSASTLGQTPRRCITCDVDATPKWWPVDTISAPTRPSTAAGLTNGASADRYDVPNGTPAPPDAKDLAVQSPAGDVSVDRATNFQCHKCHWKRLHAPPEDAKPPEPQQSQPPPLPDYPRSSHPHAPWVHPNGIPAQAAVAPPPRPGGGAWPVAAAGVSHAPTPLANGVIASPPPTAYANAHPYPPTGHPHHPHPHPHQQPNGYPAPPPVTAAAGVAHHPHPGPPPSSVRSAYVPRTSAAPAPLHLANATASLGGGAMPNGMHSPHLPLHSPTHPPPGSAAAVPPARRTESPLAGPYGGVPPPPHSQQTRPGSPRTGRPSTPREQQQQHRGEPREPGSAGLGGASASPSLRNLLH